MSNPNNIQNRFRFFTFYKWGAMACLGLSIIFLFVGIAQSASGGSVIDPIKPDFSNLSADNPVSINLQEAENIGVEYVEKTSRRSTNTYNYFVIKTQDRKFILETDDKDEVKKGASINIKSKISPITAENQSNIKTLATKNIANENAKLGEDELLDIKFVTHYTESDRLGSDYWGWMAFGVLLFAALVLGIRYWWDKRNYTIAIQDIRQISADYHSPNQALAQNYQYPENSNRYGGSNQTFLESNSPISNENDYQNSYQNNYQNNRQSSYRESPVFNPDPNYGTFKSPDRQNKTKKTTYVLSAIFLGIFGVHHFYEQKVVFGLLHLSWLFCMIIPLFALNQLSGFFLLAFVLLPITLLVSIIQALVRLFSKE